MKKYFSNKKFLSGIILTGLVSACMLVGCIWLPYDPTSIDVSHKLLFFNSSHLLGTDNLGRDILSRILVGYRISFLTGFSASVFGLVTGVVIGAMGGYFGGAADATISRFIDMLMAFPGILLALMFVAISSPGLKNTIIAISIMSVPRFARISRSGFMKYRDSFLVLSARARGASFLRIMIVHILPNIYSDLIVTFTLSFAYAIMDEAGLSYLGLGIQPPAASFGSMLNDAQNYLFTAPWFVLIPTASIAIAVTGLTLLGDGITGISERNHG